MRAKFPLEEVFGRPVSSPNRMARMFDEEYGTEAQQLDPVVFLDGHERSQSAEEATVAEFRESWKRPKWHIFVQGK
jgi:hypothetical protein